MFLGLFTTVILNIVTYIYIDSIMNEKITMIEDDFKNSFLFMKIFFEKFYFCFRL